MEASFCYLGNMLSAGGGCELVLTTVVKTAFKTFRGLLTVSSLVPLPLDSYKTHGHVHSSHMQSSMPVKLGHRPSQTFSSCMHNRKLFSYFSTKTYVVGTQGFFSGVSGAVIRPLSQWQMPTFFPNLNKKIPNQKVIFM